MLVSPVPIYLGCVGLIVGSLGLGAHHMIGGNSVSATNAPPEQPLFARSVEEAALPASQWPAQNLDVAFYGPTVELLTHSATSPEPQPAAAPGDVPQTQEQQTAAAPPEVVRDLPRQQTKQPSKRAKNTRAKDDLTASSKQSDPRDARAQERQRTAAQAREGDMRSRAERPQREPRIVVREEVREPEQRAIRAPEPRETVGFNPLRIFGGIFEPR